jgi:nitronate monooxygenase
MALPGILRTRLRLPVIGAPLFIISSPELVIAECKAGVVGSFPALNARPAPVLDAWLKRITDALKEHDERHPGQPSAPFAVNQIVHKSNDRLYQDLDLCVKYRVPIVITSLGAREDVNRAVHSYGGVVLHDVINQTFARKAVEKGADGLILVAAGAGGHAGTLSPFAFVAETRQWFDGPIVLSGAIATGNAVLAAEAAPISPMLARPSSPRARPMPALPTSRGSSTGRRRTSSTPTFSPGCMATISAPRSSPPGLIPTTCRRAIPAG